jgi:hypothetical protein
MTDRHDDDRLWQGELPPDLERWRAAASRLPLPAEPDWGAPRVVRLPRPVFARPGTWLAMAASLVVLLGVAAARDGWRVETLAGRPGLSGLAFAGRVATGGALTTDASSRARLEVPGLGVVTLEPGGRLRRVRGRGAERRLELDRGTLHARIVAPPRIFVVGTSVGDAVDLGCEYTLAMDDSTGTGRLQVTAGRVVFESGGLESLLPAGLWCPLTSAGPGVPRRADASAEFLAAVAVTDNPECRADDFTAVVGNAGPADAITLWHLLPRVQGDVRRQVAERFLALVDVEPVVPLERVVALEPAALGALWNALGMGTLEDWRRPGFGVKGKPAALVR